MTEEKEEVNFEFTDQADKEEVNFEFHDQTDKDDDGTDDANIVSTPDVNIADNTEKEKEKEKEKENDKDSCFIF